MKHWYDISLYDEYNFSGAFKIEGIEGTYGGSVQCKPRFQYTARISSFSEQPINKSDLYKKALLGQGPTRIGYMHCAFDDNVNITCIDAVIQFVRSNTYHAIFDNLIFNGCFDHNDEFEGAVVVFNVWEQFMLHTQSIDTKEIIDKRSEVTINDDVIISLREWMICKPIDPIYGLRWADSETQKKIKSHMEEYCCSIGAESCVLHKQRHIFYIDITQKITLKTINVLLEHINKISQFLFVLTAFPVTPEYAGLKKIKMSQKGTESDTIHPWIFPGVLEKRLKDRYNKQHNIENMMSFDDVKECWDEALTSFYNEYDNIIDIIEKIYQAFKVDYFSEFNLAAVIDALSIIATIKQYNNNTKYQDVIKEFAFPCLLGFLNELFKTTSHPQKLGKTISDLRTSIVHPKLECKITLDEMTKKTPRLIELLALPSFNYIQQELGIPENIRKKFQDNWVKIYKNYVYMD